MLIKDFVHFDSGVDIHDTYKPVDAIVDLCNCLITQGMPTEYLPTVAAIIQIAREMDSDFDQTVRITSATSVRRL